MMVVPVLLERLDEDEGSKITVDATVATPRARSPGARFPNLDLTPVGF